MIPAASYARPPYYYVPVPTVVVDTAASVHPIVVVRDKPSVMHSIVHNRGYIPAIDTYTLSGERIYCDISADDTTAVVAGNIPFPCLIVIW
jgi:hypothetical protein